MKKHLKKVLSLLLCVPIICMPTLVQGSTANVTAAADNATLGYPILPNVPEGFTTRIEVEDFYKHTGNIYIRENGDMVPGSAAADNVVLTGASGGKFVDFSNPVANYKTGSGSNNNTIPSGQDKASWRVTVPAAGVYELAFKYNNPATKVDGYRNVRDERNSRIIINDDEPDFTNTMDPHWAGWMIFNMSGYIDSYNPETNTSLTPQTDNGFANVKGNTAWNNNYMNVWLEKGENTVTLGMEAPPGQAVYDGPNLDYFDVTYIGDQYVSEDEIPFLGDDFVFQHPGVSFTLEDLDNIKANKDNMDTVYGKGYQELVSATTWFDNNTVNPVPVLDVGPYNSPNIGGTEYTRGGSKALYYALRYYLDGDAAYGKKARDVLSGWAGTLKTLGLGNDLKLRISIVGTDFVNAAEILKHVYNNDPGVAPADKWQEANIAEFDTFLQLMLTKTYDFYPQANGNWDAIIGGFNMAAAVYFEDADLFNDALKQRYLGTYREGNAVSMGSLPSYIYPSGEQQESSRDQPHARMGITGLASQADIAWNQGIDLYGANDNRLLTGTMYNARYAVGEEVESATFISDRNRTQSGIWAVGYEIVGNHYLNEVADAAAEGETDLIYKAAEMRLRTGSVNNEAGRKANYFGAMIFTDKPYNVAMTLSANKNTLSSAGDEIVLTANVQTDSSIKRVNWDIPESLKPYIDYEIINDTMLKLKLREKPDLYETVGVIKATSVKKATVSDTFSISIDTKPPVTTAAVSPAQPDGLNGWYGHAVTVNLSVYDNLSGPAKTEYSLDGGHTWQTYTTELMFDKDDKYTVSYRSTDNAGNAEAVKTIGFKLDSTLPTIKVTGLMYGTYSNSMDITPILTLSDNLSGVDSSRTTVTISTYGKPQTVQQGATIPLYTLPLGSHTFIVTASDLAGNTSSQTVLFQTTTNVQSLQALVTRFTNTGWIDNAGIANSLQSKLAKNNLDTFVSEVQAQSGKHISAQAAGYLLRDAQYLLSK